MIQRLASDEPDEVGLVPKPITFWHHGREYAATVSKSGLKMPVLLAEHGVMYALRGDFGRAWVADPCSMALQDGLHASRMAEDKAASQARADRRKAKAALLEEEAAARRTKTSRW